MTDEILRSGLGRETFATFTTVTAENNGRLGLPNF